MAVLHHLKGVLLLSLQADLPGHADQPVRRTLRLADSVHAARGLAPTARLIAREA